MILVMDASSLIALARIEQLGVLRALAPRVVVSPRVYEEVALDPTKPGATAVIAASWIEQVPMTTAEAELAHELARENKIALGEAETIAIASTCSGAIAVIDEKRARKVARERGVGFTGTVKLLVRARRAGLVPAVAPLLDALTAINFHLGEVLRKAALAEAGETQDP